MTLEPNQRLDFSIYEGSGVLWLAPADFGGHSADEVDRLNAVEGGLTRLVKDGHWLAAGFFEDGGYMVRVLIGELSAAESEEWISRVSGRLKLPGGRLCLGGNVSRGCFAKDYARFAQAVHRGHCDDGAWVDVPPGEYLVEIYNFLPYNLSGNTEIFDDESAVWDTDVFDAEIKAWFERTRPGQKPPFWIETGTMSGDHVDLLVRLAPWARVRPADVPESETDGQGISAWTYRRPERCPLGISLN